MNPIALIAKSSGAMVGAGLAWAAVLGSNLDETGAITAAAVVIVAGLFTLRNSIRSFWKEQALERGEKIKALQAEAEASLKERAAFAEQQRELRHALKNDLAVAQAQLDSELAKHDFTALYSRLDMLQGILESRDALFTALTLGIQEQSALLSGILNELRKTSALRAQDRDLRQEEGER